MITFIRIKQKLTLAAALMIAILAALSSAQEEAKETVVVGFSFNPMVTQTNFGNKGSADLRGMLQDVAKEAEKRYGYTVTLKFYSTPKFLFNALKSGEASFAPLTTSLYLAAKRQNLPVKPLLAATSTSDKKDKICLFVSKDSRIKKVKDLQGKTFGAEIPLFFSKKDSEPPSESYIYWAMIRKILAQNGVQKPLKDFFKTFTVLPISSESIAYSVLLKKFDAVLLNERDFHLMTNTDPSFKELAPVDCLHLPANAPLVYRSGTKPELVALVKEYFTKSKKTEAQKILKEEFTGMHLVEVQETDYAPYFQWLQEAEKKGWLKEFYVLLQSAAKQK